MGNKSLPPSYILEAAKAIMLENKTEEGTKLLTDGLLSITERLTGLVYTIHPLDAPLALCCLRLLVDMLAHNLKGGSLDLADTLYDLLKDQRDGIRIDAVDIEELLRQLAEERDGQ